MSEIKTVIILLICGSVLWGCKDDTNPQSYRGSQYNQDPVSIDFYPQGRDYKWTYAWEETNGADTVRLTSYDSYNYFYGWIEGRGRAPYLDHDGKPGKCGLTGFGGNLIMANFCLPDSSADSILLGEFMVGSNVLSAYQFTKRDFVLESKIYKNIPCIKTLLIGEIDSTEITYKYSWYGKDVGLVKQLSRSYKNNKPASGYTKILITTNF